MTCATPPPPSRPQPVLNGHVTFGINTLVRLDPCATPPLPTDVLCELSCTISDNQLHEINIWKTNASYKTVSVLSCVFVLVVAVPMMAVSYAKL